MYLSISVYNPITKAVISLGKKGVRQGGGMKGGGREAQGGGTLD